MTMMDLNDKLFSRARLDDILRQYIAAIPESVKAIPKDQFAGTSIDTLVEHIVSELEIEPLTIYEDRMVMTDPQESMMDVRGDFNRDIFDESQPAMFPSVRVTVSLPYTGKPDLWQVRSNPGRLTFPFGNVQRPDAEGIGNVDIVIERPHDVLPQETKKVLDEQLDGIRFAVEKQAAQIVAYHASLPGQVRQAVEVRRERLEKQDGLVGTMGIPLKRRGDAAPVEPIKIKRKLVRPLPPAPQSGVKPEPGINEQDFETILAVIRNVGRSFEQTPKTFAIHDEEQLRDIVLANLNSIYEGDATGETFNKSGKTDIRILDKERAAFVAECKVWEGAKALLDGLDQLLGYLTWRDCKSAMVIFNKHNAGFSKIQEKVPDTLKQDVGYLRELPSGKAGEWRFVFKSQEDAGREITVHVFAFDIFVR